MLHGDNVYSIAFDLKNMQLNKVSLIIAKQFYLKLHKNRVALNIKTTE